MKHNRKKGFSLVELITVVVIMGILLAILAPALTRYMEDSRKGKDDKNADELVQAVRIAITDPYIFDEIQTYLVGNNYAYYSALSDEADDEKTDMTKIRELKAIGYGVDEERGKLNGNMLGITITFPAVRSEMNFNNALINVWEGTEIEGTGDSHTVHAADDRTPTATCEMGVPLTEATKLYRRLHSIIGTNLDVDSQAYRNSNFTVFIHAGTHDGNISAYEVYGLWDGVDLLN